MIRASFTAVPKRLPVLWAKAIVYGLTLLALMVPSVLLAFLVGESLFSRHHINIPFSHPGVARAVFGAALYLTVVGFFGLGLGAIVRNTAGGIASFAAIMFVLPPLMNVLPTSWNDAASPYLPLAAGEAIMSITPGNHLSPWVGLALFFGYAAAALAVAAVLLVRRDTYLLGPQVLRWRHRSRRVDDGVRANSAEKAHLGSRRREAADADERTCVRRLDHLIVADVERDVSRPVELRLEEHEIAGLQLRRIELREGCELRGGVVRQVHAELRIDKARETGAVEAGRRNRAAPDIRHAEVVLRDRDGGRARRRRRVVVQPRLRTERDRLERDRSERNLRGRRNDDGDPADGTRCDRVASLMRSRCCTRGYWRRRDGRRARLNENCIS
jgi:hypothetical protein